MKAVTSCCPEGSLDPPRCQNCLLSQRSRGFKYVQKFALVATPPFPILPKLPAPFANHPAPPPRIAVDRVEHDAEP